MAKKESWQPSAPLARAISVVEGQPSWKNDWGTSEHCACIRYLVEEICIDAKEPLTDTQKAALKKAVGEDTDFIAYASNAKKKLLAFGTLTPKAEEYR